MGRGSDRSKDTRRSIAYLSNLYPAASHTFIRREIHALERRGLDVTRIAVRAAPLGELPDELDVAEHRITETLLGGNPTGLAVDVVSQLVRRPIRTLRAFAQAARMGWSSAAGMIKHCAYAVEACGCAAVMRRNGVSHVHAHFGTNATTVAMLAAELLGGTFSFTAHGPVEFDDPRGLHLAEKVRRAQFVAVISHFARSQVFRWCDPEDWAKVHVVRCGVDAGFLDTPATPIADRPRLVCVARLGPAKGLPILVDAAARLRDQGVQMEIVLIGDGPLREGLERRIAELELRDLFRFAGTASGDEVRSLILSSRAMVLPSFLEGLPVVIMEALALRRPVVTTWVAGVPELVEDGRNGWLIPPGDVERLALAMHAAITADPATLDAMGEDGHQRVRRQHDVQQEADKLGSLIEGVLGVPEGERGSCDG